MFDWFNSRFQIIEVLVNLNINEQKVLNMKNREKKYFKN